MAAVNPTRLRHQVGELMALFEAPVEFHQALCTLFSLYANHGLRFGEAAPVRPLIPMFHLPHPVVRQLNLDLKTQIAANSSAALALANELWNDTYYEVRQTALFVLGEVVTDDPEPILDRLKGWLTPDLDQVLKSDLFSIGTRSLQENFPQTWETWVRSLLSDPDPKVNTLGIQALAAGAQRPNFQNLPTIFRLSSPFIRDVHSANLKDLEALVSVLAEISPQETGFYLRQTLSISSSFAKNRLIKNCLKFFPEEIQADLKSVLEKDNDFPSSLSAD